MDLPTAVADDIRQNQDISLVVRVDSILDDSSVQARVLLTDIEGNDVSLTLFENSPTYDLVEDQWYLFKEASGNIYEGQKELRPNFGDMSVKKVDPPKDLISEAEKDSDPVPTNTDPDAARLALDIETVQTVEEDELDLRNSKHLELLCIGVGYQPSPTGPVEADVLFRNGPSPTAELDLINELCDWLEAREATTLLTYNGEFDLGHIQGRAELATEATSNRDNSTIQWAKNLFDRLNHNDLKRPGMSLETVADIPETHWDIYNHELDPTDWRQTQQELGNFPEARPLDDPVISGSDIPYFGEEFLTSSGATDSVQQRALYEMIYRYAVSDVEPLFDL